MKFILSEVKINKPCEYLKDSNILSKNNNNIFKNFSYNDLFAVLFSSKQLNNKGTIKIFNDNNILSHIDITETLFAKSLSISDNIIAVGLSDDKQGQINFYNILKTNKISELKYNKSWFGNNIHFNKDNFFTYYHEDGKIIIQKYNFKYAYINKELKFNTDLIKQIEINCKSSEVLFSSNSFHLFVSTPHEKIGCIYVLDFDLNYLQNLCPNELSLSVKEYSMLKNNGYGLSIDSNDQFLIVGAPNLYQCFNENDNINCYRGIVYVYRINKENKFDLVLKINNPTSENSSTKSFNDYFSVGLKLYNNILYIGNPSENNSKGVIHTLKINEDNNIELLNIMENPKGTYGTGFDVSININNFICINSFECKEDSTFVPSIVILENK
jgi:hypothetical protein